MSWECISYWIEHHPGLASWVQAVGSIGAIIAAIWISGGERRHRARIEKAARRDAIDRAIDAGEQAKKTVENNLEFFSCTRPLAREVPRFLDFIIHTSVRIKDASMGPGVDNEVLGHVSEISNALVDVKGLVENCARTSGGQVILDLGYLKGNIDRIERAISSLRALRK
ncbi:hypothetical protein N0B28_13520 [Pseudomonas sp. SD17-1]|uniref:hypothetical protein n=1 Tax=Pseudomonas sp. SD17-1 TaxID=2976883 RepID=UPI0023DC1D77|nr:hypothetical protein [Pseudomonas sp. SD17-1]WEJ19324.1 hypothetical protein N0B28_13520 [Pseudomonas sp. SD17-1]